MKSLCWTISLLLVSLTNTGFAQRSIPGGALELLIEGARQEGTVDISGPSSLTPRGALALINSLNQKYGLTLRVNFSPATSYTRIAAQLITELSLGQPPSFDLVFMSDFNLTKLYERDLLEPFHWLVVFPEIPPEAVMLGGRMLHVATRFALPAYNTRAVSPNEVPQKWEDLLDPKWKGRIMVPRSPDIWIPLTQKWGRDQTLRFVERLHAQEPIILRYPEIDARLKVGEFPLAAVQISAFIFPAQGKGAPVAFAEKVEPVPARLDFLAVMKKAKHPNAAKLLGAFSLTAAGQAIWGKTEFGARSSMFTRGSPAWRFAQGKEVFMPDLEFLLREGEGLEKEFARILKLR